MSKDDNARKKKKTCFLREICWPKNAESMFRMSLSHHELDIARNNENSPFWTQAGISRKKKVRET